MLACPATVRMTLTNTNISGAIYLNQLRQNRRQRALQLHIGHVRDRMEERQRRSGNRESHRTNSGRLADAIRVASACEGSVECYGVAGERPGERQNQAYLQSTGSVLK